MAWGTKGPGPGRLGIIFRVDAAFVFRLYNSVIFRLATAIIFRLDAAIIFRLDTAIIFRLDTAIISRLAIIHQICNKYALFDFQTPFLQKKNPGGHGAG